MQLVLDPLDEGSFHLFLSHAWPTAQDVMRVIKARFAVALPSCCIFLDVDNLSKGSGTEQIDKSGSVLVYLTRAYFQKMNSMKELYRAVVNRRPIIVVLEPDASQDGGMSQSDIEALLTDAHIDRFKLRKRYTAWKDKGEVAADGFDHAPGGADVAAALFAIKPVEWSRLPQFQDVTIRLIAQKGVLHGSEELYMQGEVAMDKVTLPRPFNGRRFHLFCSEHNAGAAEVAAELQQSDVWQTNGKVHCASLSYTTDPLALDECDHMLLLLDDRTWTSGETSKQLIEHLYAAMRLGVRVQCVHEFPSLVGPHRHECEFARMFSEQWTPAHLQAGVGNLYKEIALSLKAEEWRKPGLVSIARKLSECGGEREPIDIDPPAPDDVAEEAPSSLLPANADHIEQVREPTPHVDRPLLLAHAAQLASPLATPLLMQPNPLHAQANPNLDRNPTPASPPSVTQEATQEATQEVPQGVPLPSPVAFSDRLMDFVFSPGTSSMGEQSTVARTVIERTVTERTVRSSSATNVASLDA